MNWADIAIIAILALSVLVSLWRGLIAEVLALAIWVAAVWVAWLLGPRVATGFDGLIEVPSVRIILSYALCFVAVLIAGALIKFLIARLVAGTGLSGSDRLLGTVFGLARGVLLVTLVVFLLGFTPVQRDPWWHQSRLLPTFARSADWLGEHLPDTVKAYLHPEDRQDASPAKTADALLSGQSPSHGAKAGRPGSTQSPTHARTVRQPLPNLPRDTQSRDN